MNENDPSVPYGYCHCGCGGKTNIAPQTWRKHCWVKGEPLRFILGHANRKQVRYIETDCGHETPCWVWQLWITRDGYPRVWSDGGSTLAHRMEWERVNGPIPEGLHLDHLCRNRACVNPAHLEPVTPAENTRRSATAKLTGRDVGEIRELLAAGETQTSIAWRFGVSQTTISAIVTGRIWRPD